MACYIVSPAFLRSTSSSHHVTSIPPVCPPRPPTPGRDFWRICHRHAAQNQDELSFSASELIMASKKSCDGWFYGSLKVRQL